MSVNKKNRSLWGSRSEAQRIYYQRQTIKRLEKENKELKEKCEKQQYAITENCDLRKQIDKITQQRQELRSWLEEEMNICDGVISTRTSDFQELGGRSAGKTFIQTEILKNKVALKSFELALNKLNELEGKNE